MNDTPIDPVAALLSLFRQPDLFLADLCVSENKAVVIRMDARIYREAPCLDGSLTQRLFPAFETDLSELFELSDALGASVEPPYFVFHTAFACSTLLIRSLRAFPTLFTLNEPRTLNRVVSLILSGDLGDSPEQMRGDLVRLAATFLGRRYHDHSRTVVKANDLASGILNEVLAHTKAQVVLLVPPLRSFLAATLKSPERRDWTRARLAAFPAPMRARPLQVAELSDSRCAALLWLTHVTLFGHAVANPAWADRTVMVNSMTLLDHPQAVIMRVLRHFGEAQPAGAIEAVTRSAVFLTHAKRPGEPYTRADFDREQERVLASCTDEALEAMSWVAGMSGIPVGELASGPA